MKKIIENKNQYSINILFAELEKIGFYRVGQVYVLNDIQKSEHNLFLKLTYDLVNSINQLEGIENKYIVKNYPRINMIDIVIK